MNYELGTYDSYLPTFSVKNTFIASPLLASTEITRL